MNYELCEELIDHICTNFPHSSKLIIGKSICGRNLSVLKIGNGTRRLLFVGTHHAMEHIMAPVLLRYAEELCECPPCGCAVYILPMLNPDGVALHFSGGIYSDWQANYAGVDLNHNYNAKWEQAKLLEPSYGVTGPCASRYGGESPESEPETAALCRFVREIRFSAAIAFHTQGEEIYYDFCGKSPEGSLSLARIMAELTGYLLSSPEGIASYGGFKDWCIDELNIPAFTIEAGFGKNPLPAEDGPLIYRKLKKMLFELPQLCCY
jgi:g-D-glutamyl-meso-diaminopimelate peptidase